MIHIGVNIPTNAPDARVDTVVEFGRRAEAAGVDGVYVLDRLVFDNVEPLLSLAQLTTVTSRVTLGTCVLLATLRPPVLLAKMIATLDQMSGGRMLMGLGAGSRPDDFAGAGVPFEHRGSRFEEAVEIMRLAWTGAPIKFSGRFYNIDVGPIGPTPVQQPGVPLYFGGSAESVLRRVGRMADGYMATSSGGPAGFREGWKKVQEYAERAGRDPSSIVPGALLHCCVDENKERAIELSRRQRAHYYGPARAGVAAGSLIGSPDECVEQAQEYIEAGARLLVLGSVTADVNYFDRLIHEVAPRLQRAA
jgi:probable F420-dependent oxidoreductase